MLVKLKAECPASDRVQGSTRQHPDSAGVVSHLEELPVHTSIVNVVVEGRLFDYVSNVSREPLWSRPCNTGEDLN